MTLDEYRKKQGGLDIVPKLEGRKVDDSAFKGAVVVTKKDEEETAYFVGKVCLLSLKDRKSLTWFLSDEKCS